jgi:hypothetical protein
MNTAELQALLDGTWDVQIIAKKYSVTGQCVRQWVIRNGLPALHIPGTRIALRFLPSDVLAWKVNFNKQKRKWRRGNNKIHPRRHERDKREGTVRGRVRPLPRIVRRRRLNAA